MRVSRFRAGAVLALCAVPTLCAAQGVSSFIVRADLAALQPSTAKGVHLAWSVGAGWQVATHSTLYLDFSRQNLSDELEGQNSFWQNYVGASWEYALGAAAIYRRQLLFTVRGGALLRQRPFDDAPYLGVGVGLRYPVTNAIHFEARLEDDMDYPQRQTVQVCESPSVCSALLVGGRLEHNFGLFLGAAFHP